MSAFKLASLEAVAIKEEEGKWITIEHPAGGPLVLGNQKKPLRIRVAGSYSKTYRDLAKRLRDEMYKKRGKLDGADAERREISTLAACTLEWEGAFDDDGKEIPLTKPNAETLYRAARFIADQVDAEITDHAGFFENSSKS